MTWLTNGTPASSGGDWQPGSGTRADAGGCGALGRRAADRDPVPRRRERDRRCGWGAASAACC